jgi:hypothetical protein
MVLEIAVVVAGRIAARKASASRSSLHRARNRYHQCLLRSEAAEREHAKYPKSSERIGAGLQVPQLADFPEINVGFGRKRCHGEFIW